MRGSILSVVVALVALAGCGGSDEAASASSASEKEGASAGTQPSPQQDAPTRYELVLNRPFTEGYEFAIRVEITDKTEGSGTTGEETKPFSSTQRHTVDAAAVVEGVGPAGQRTKLRFTIRAMEGALDGAPLECLPSGTEIIAEVDRALSIPAPDGSNDAPWLTHQQVRRTLNQFLPLKELDRMSREELRPPGPVAIGERWDIDGGYVTESLFGQATVPPEAEFSGWAQLDDVTMVDGNETALVTVHMEATNLGELQRVVSETTQQFPLDPTKHSSGRTARGEMSVSGRDGDVDVSYTRTVEINEVWAHP